MWIYVSYLTPSLSHNPGEIVSFLIFLFMVTREAEIGFKTSTFLHITMMEYTLSTQSSLEDIYQQGGGGEIFKILIKAVYYFHIKNILIIVIQAYQHTLIQK